jgi:hypothetical protein
MLCGLKNNHTIINSRYGIVTLNSITIREIVIVDTSSFVHRLQLLNLIKHIMLNIFVFVSSCLGRAKHFMF